MIALRIEAPDGWHYRPGKAREAEATDAMLFSASLPWSEGDIERLLAQPDGVKALRRLLRAPEGVEYGALRQWSDADLVLLPRDNAPGPVYVIELKKKGDAAGAAVQLARNLAAIEHAVRGFFPRCGDIHPVVAGPWSHDEEVATVWANLRAWRDAPPQAPKTHVIALRAGRREEDAYLLVDTELSSYKRKKSLWPELDEAEGRARDSLSAAIKGHELEVTVRFTPTYGCVRVAAVGKVRDRALREGHCDHAAVGALRRIRKGMKLPGHWNVHHEVGQRLYSTFATVGGSPKSWADAASELAVQLRARLAA